MYLAAFEQATWSIRGTRARRVFPRIRTNRANLREDGTRAPPPSKIIKCTLSPRPTDNANVSFDRDAKNAVLTFSLARTSPKPWNHIFVMISGCRTRKNELTITMAFTSFSPLLRRVQFQFCIFPEPGGNSLITQPYKFFLQPSFVRTKNTIPGSIQF